MNLILNSSLNPLLQEKGICWRPGLAVRSLKCLGVPSIPLSSTVFRVQGKLSAKEAVQLHGGMGVSEEMMIGHYLKKMISIDALFGNADYHLKTFS